MESYTERDIVIAMSVYLKHCDVWLAAFRAGCLCCVLIIFFWFSGLYIIVRLIFGAKCFVEARRLISSCLLYLWICIQCVFRWFPSVWFSTWTVNLIGLWSTNWCRRSGRLWAGRFSKAVTVNVSSIYNVLIGPTMTPRCLSLLSVWKFCHWPHLYNLRPRLHSCCLTRLTVEILLTVLHYRHLLTYYLIFTFHGCVLSTVLLKTEYNTIQLRND